MHWPAVASGTAPSRLRSDQPRLAAAQRIDSRIGLADITLACFCTYVRDAVPFELDEFPALSARVARYEALPALQKYYVPFDAPVPGAAAPAKD